MPFILIAIGCHSVPAAPGFGITQFPVTSAAVIDDFNGLPILIRCSFFSYIFTKYNSLPSAEISILPMPLLPTWANTPLSLLGVLAFAGSAVDLGSAPTLMPMLFTSTSNVGLEGFPEVLMYDLYIAPIPLGPKPACLLRYADIKSVLDSLCHAMPNTEPRYLFLTLRVLPPLSDKLYGKT